MTYTLTIDSLTIQASSSSLQPFDYRYITEKYAYKANYYQPCNNVQLYKIQQLEKYYLHSFAVWVEGRHIATLSTDCRQHGQTESIKLSFENVVFYSQPGWLYYLRIIEKSLLINFKSISYLEIAYDFQKPTCLLPELCRIYRYSNFIKYNTEVEYSPADGKLTCSLIKGKEYVFGKSVRQKGTNGKQVVVYDKTAELANNLNKSYISNYYELNGFTQSDTVERIELRLSAKYISGRIPTITPDDLNDVNVLGGIFTKAVGNTFTFRKLQNFTYDSNRNKKTETVTLIDFLHLGHSLPASLPDSSQIKNVSDYRNKVEVKNTLFRFIEKGEQQDLQQLAYLFQNVKAPGSTTWSSLCGRYAKNYQGLLTTEQTARAGLFS